MTPRPQRGGRELGRVVYLVWSLPIIAVFALVGSGRAGSALAAAVGAALAVAVALLAAPVPFGPADALAQAARWAWLAWLVVAVILGGLFFKEAASAPAQAAPTAEVPARARRRRLFSTCFLVGPFAEAATGFGVGQVTTAAPLRALGLAPVHVVLFGLFSQCLVPWGAFANGTLVGAYLSGVAPADLGVRSALLTAPLLLVWLALFWRMAAEAGAPVASASQHAEEAGWVLAAAALLVAANAALGPEVAALPALGPLIAARFLLDEGLDRQRWRWAFRVGAPYAALVLLLAIGRAIPALNAALREAVAVRPFADIPPWLVLLHPAAWLLLVGVAAAVVTGRAGRLPDAARRAWAAGRRSVLAIVLFLVMARVMAGSGIAGGLASGLQATLGPAAPLAVPLLAGLFGYLTSSGNAANGLLMPSQAALAAASRVDLPWLAAVQNTAAAALTMLSPVRVAMGCALAGDPGLERATYARAWPLGAAALLVLTAAAAIIVMAGR